MTVEPNAVDLRITVIGLYYAWIFPAADKKCGPSDVGGTFALTPSQRSFLILAVRRAFLAKKRCRSCTEAIYTVSHKKTCRAN